MIEDQCRMALAKNYFAWQGRLVAREIGSRVIEAGCGIGNFTPHLLDRELVVAVDPDPASVERLRRRFPAGANLHTAVCEIGDPCFAALSRFRADSCVCLNVLEHIERDEAALRSMAAALVPGGVIVLIVPAFPALFGPVDRNLGHYRRYRQSGLLRLAAAAGLQVRTLRYLNAAGFLGWWINARLLRTQVQSEFQIRLYDRYVVPWLSRLEAVIPPPFGQSLFAVLVKP